MKIFQSQAMCMYGNKIHFSTSSGIIGGAYYNDPEYCYHDFIEIELHIKGTGIHYMNAIPYEVNPGYFFLLMPGDYHKYALNKGEAFFIYNIKIDTGYLDDGIYQTLMEMQRPFALKLSGETLKMVENEFLHLQKLWRETPENKIYIKNTAERIIIFLIEEIKKTGDYISTTNGDGVRSGSIKNVISYVEENYMKKLTSEKMAKLINVTPQYFSNLFAKETGMTFKKFITRVRLYNATILLETTSLSIKEIAYMVGFSSQAYFSRVFTKFFEKTPHMYKNRVHLSHKTSNL